MKIINNSTYLLLVDEKAKIKPDDYILHDTVEGVIIANDEWDYRGEADDYWNKIIAYHPLTKEAKELDLPLLPNSFEEADVEKIAEDRYGKYETSIDIPNKHLREGFIAGYKAASKQFSLEDLVSNFKPAFDKFINDGGAIGSSEEYIQWQNVVEWFPKFLQSLSTQQLPKGFEVNYSYKHIPVIDMIQENIKDWEWFCTKGGIASFRKLKITTNPEGKQVLVGNYKY